MSMEEGQRVTREDKKGKILVIFKDTGFVRWDDEPLNIYYHALSDLELLPDNELEDVK